MTAASHMSKSLEDRLLEQYDAKGMSHMPQTLMFDHVSPATRLLEKRRQMFEVQEALNSQKEEFSRREDAFRRREDGLRRKDLELQESLIKFNKFLQENESKRNRALKRAADEKKQREQKEIEIRRLEAELRNTLKEESVLKAELEKNIKYQDYLDSVVQTMSKFFPEISDILSRYRTLRDANTYLIEKQMADEASNETMIREYTSFRKAKENQVLNVNNEIADMQETLEKNQTLSITLQGDVDKATQEASEKVLDLCQILSSVSNILDRCEESFRIRHNKPKVDRSTDKLDGMPPIEQCLRTMSKLDEIAMFVVDLKDIRDEFMSKAGAGTASTTSLLGAGVGGNSAINGGLGDATATGGGVSKPSVAEMASKSRTDG